MFLSNLGYLVLLVALAIVAYCLYAGSERVRKKEYFEACAPTVELRAELEKQECKIRKKLIARLLIWLACAISALFCEVLGIILSIVFTAEALFRIWKEAFEASKSRTVSLIFLTGIVASLIMVIGTKYAGLIVGLILFMLTLALTTFIAYVGRLKRGER